MTDPFYHPWETLPEENSPTSPFWLARGSGRQPGGSRGFGRHGSVVRGGPGAGWSGRFKCFSGAFLGRGPDLNLNTGDKAIFPDTVLAQLSINGNNSLTTSLSSSTRPGGEPVIFQILSGKSDLPPQYCGVLEFSSDDRENVYLPYWILRNLDAQEGETLFFKQVTSMPKGTSLTLRPTTPEFYTVAQKQDTRSLLETILGKFTVLSKNLMFEVPEPTSGVMLGFVVVDVKPANAVCVVDTDIAVDFAPMPGYEEPQTTPKPTMTSNTSTTTTTTPSTTSSTAATSFTGEGNRMSEMSASSEHRVCPMCDKRIPTESYDVHVLRCERVYTRCEVCHVVLKNDAAEIAKHMTEMHTPVACELCGMKMLKTAMEEHKKSQCPARQIKCMFCDLTFPAMSYDSHIEYCGAKTASCDKCQFKCPRKDMGRHLSSNCLWRGGVGGDDRDLRGSAEVNICPYCNDLFPDLPTLVEHSEMCAKQQHQQQQQHQTQSGKSGSEFVWCPFCKSKGFAAGTAALRDHIATCNQNPASYTFDLNTLAAAAVQQPKIVDLDTEVGEFVVVPDDPMTAIVTPSKIETPPSTKPASCPICEKVLDSVDMIQIHIEQDHPDLLA